MEGRLEVDLLLRPFRETWLRVQVLTFSNDRSVVSAGGEKWTLGFASMVAACLL